MLIPMLLLSILPNTAPMEPVDFSFANDIVTEIVQKNEEQEPEQETEVPEEEPETITCEVTAYCSCCECSDEYGTLTASGTQAEAGRTVAVDPDVIPLGSLIEIDGNVYVAEDTGGAVQGCVIDIYMDCHEETECYGRQLKEVTILE